jgi:hypothetical protein
LVARLFIVVLEQIQHLPAGGRGFCTAGCADIQQEVHPGYITKCTARLNEQDIKKEMLHHWTRDRRAVFLAIIS